jgi:hypothetical protein
MCQGAARRQCNPSRDCYVRKVARLLAQALLRYVGTLIVYPNAFHDVPSSLETAMAFAAVRGSSDFFAPVGDLAILTGLGTLILGCLFLAPKLDLIRRGHSGPFRCLSKADRSRVRGRTLVEACHEGSSRRIFIHGLLEVLSSQNHVPRCELAVDQRRQIVA